MRIISGKARGTKLFTLEGQTTRPTLDRVKESLFNILQNEILESTFLDLFAGSGAIGLEAASRGAKKVYLCEKDKQAVAIVRKNIEKTHLQNIVELYPLDYQDFLYNLKEKVDLVYLDPPYKTDFALNAIRILVEKKLLYENSCIIVETDQDEVIKEIEDLPIVEIIDKRKYGRAFLLFLKERDTKRKG